MTAALRHREIVKHDLKQTSINLLWLVISGNNKCSISNYGILERKLWAPW